MLAAADRLFRERGFGRTTVRQIAAEAQVSAGTVAGVGGKDALLVAIVDEWIGAVHAARSAAPASGAMSALTTAEATERLRAAVEPFVGYFLGDGELSREYAAVLARGKHRSETFGRLALELIGDFAGVLTAAGHPDPGAGARTLYFVYIGILFTASAGALGEDAARAALTEGITQVLHVINQSESELNP